MSKRWFYRQAYGRRYRERVQPMWVRWLWTVGLVAITLIICWKLSGM